MNKLKTIKNVFCNAIFILTNIHPILSKIWKISKRFGTIWSVEGPQTQLENEISSQ